MWQRLDREQQNQLIGRDKVTGCPLVTVSPPQAPAGCPVVGKRIWASDNEFREARETTDRIVRDSHIQRANHQYDDPALPTSLRVFRQGYPFFETCAGAPGYRIGLNFVSFQGTPARLIGLLSGHNWFGGVNFGGARQAGPPLVTAHAAGMFFVRARTRGVSGSVEPASVRAVAASGRPTQAKSMSRLHWMTILSPRSKTTASADALARPWTNCPASFEF